MKIYWKTFKLPVEFQELELNLLQRKVYGVLEKVLNQKYNDIAYVGYIFCKCRRTAVNFKGLTNISCDLPA